MYSNIKTRHRGLSGRSRPQGRSRGGFSKKSNGINPSVYVNKLVEVPIEEAYSATHTLTIFLWLPPSLIELIVADI